MDRFTYPDEQSIVPAAHVGIKVPSSSSAVTFPVDFAQSKRAYNLLGHFGFRYSLCEQVNRLKQEVAVALFDRLANAFEQSHAFVGHRGVPFVVGSLLPTTRG
jgi:hypothetical protein